MAERIGKISTAARQSVKSLDEIVWAVNPREDTLPLLAEYLTASAGEFLARAGIPLRLDGPRDLPDLAVSGISFPGGAAGVTNQKQFQVAYTVANNGLVGATGPWTDRVYLVGSAGSTLR